MARRELGRYEDRSVVEQIGVVRLQDDAGAMARGLIQGTAALAETSERMVRQAEAIYQADFEVDQRKKMAELKAAHALDPEAFRGAWEAHAAGTLASVAPVFRQRARMTLSAVGGSGYESVVNHTAARTEENARTSWRMRERILGEEMASYARGGKMATDEMKAAQEAYQAWLQEGVKLMIIDDAGAALMSQATAATVVAQGVAAEARNAIARGGIAAAEKLMKKLDTDPYFAAANRNPASIEGAKRTIQHEIDEAKRRAAAARASVREDLEEYAARVANGFRVDVDEANKKAEAAEKFGDKKLAARWRSLATKGAAIEQFGSLGLADQERALKEAFDKANDPKSGPEAIAEFSVMKKVYDRSRAAYAADPFRAAVRSAREEQPAPQTFTTPDAFDNIKARIEQADRVSTREGATVVPLYTEEKLALLAALEAAPAKDRAMLRARIDAALGKYAPAFWRETASGDGPAAKSASAERNASLAMIARSNPGIAREIDEGREVRLANKHYAPSDSELTRQRTDAFYGPAFRMMPGAREVMQQEVMDIYAKMARDEGDTSGKFDERRYRKAFERRFGGEMIEHNGVKVMPPAHGFDETRWRSLMRNTSNANLGLGVDDKGQPRLPVMPRTGRRIGADAMTRRGRPFAVGDGAYVWEYEGEILVDPRTGRPFVWDYRSAFPTAPGGR